MTRRGCFTVFLSVYVVIALVILSAPAGARSAAAPSLCTRVADKLRRSPGKVAEDAAAPSHWLQPWIVFARRHPAQKMNAYHKILPIWRSSLGPRPPTAIELLPGAGIMRASRMDAGDCSHAMFFKWRPGAALSVLALPPLKFTPCLYRHQLGRLATVLKRPAYVESETLDDTRLDPLMLISTWSGGSWTRPCPVAIRFTYAARLKRGWRYCGAHRAVCTAARYAASAIERRYHEYLVSSVTVVTERVPTPQIRFAESLSERAWALISRAQRIATVKSIVAINGALPPWAHDFNLQNIDYFSLRLNGKQYIGAISPLVYGVGTLYGVYQAPRAASKRLTALAVFRMLWEPNGVRSIEVRARRERHGPGTSFGIL